MKKYTRIWAIVLMLTLIFSFEGLAVFANTDNEQGTDVVGDSELEAVQQEAKAEGESDPVTYTVTWKNWDGTVLDEGPVKEGEVPKYTGSTPTKPAEGEYTYEFSGWSPEPVAVTGPAVYTAQFKEIKKAAPKPAVRGLGAFAGAGQTSNPNGGFVSLFWNPDSASVKYEIYVDGRYVGKAYNSSLRKTPTSSAAGGKKLVCFNVPNLDEYKMHTFKVVAYNEDGVTAQATVKKQPIRPMNYVMKMKGSVTLSSHGGKSQRITLSKNATVKAYGFASGKYVFKKNGSIFYLARSRGKNIYADYAKSYNYTRADAENYVNMANIGSSSKSRLIWVSTYCQHVYYFKGSKGNWRCVNDWECSTGTARSPSPSGMWGNKEIHKFIKRRHGLRYWSCYSSMNAFHGKQSSWKMGRPASSGCIRNANGNAEYLYKNTPKWTKVLIN